MLLAFIRWWYGAGWAGTVTESRRYLGGISQNFSVGILLRTLFSPWKQLNGAGGANQSLGDRFRQSIDRLVSRFVGFMVRLFTLMAALVSLIVTLFVRLVWVMAWPLLPLMVPAALLYSIGVF